MKERLRENALYIPSSCRVSINWARKINEKVDVEHKVPRNGPNKVTRYIFKSSFLGYTMVNKKKQEFDNSSNNDKNTISKVSHP